MTIKTHGSVRGDGPGFVLIQTGVRPGRITLEAFDVDTAKVHLDDAEAINLAIAIVGALADRMRDRSAYKLAAPAHTCPGGC